MEFFGALRGASIFVLVVTEVPAGYWCWCLLGLLNAMPFSIYGCISIFISLFIFNLNLFELTDKCQNLYMAMRIGGILGASWGAGGRVWLPPRCLLVAGVGAAGGSSNAFSIFNIWPYFYFCIFFSKFG